MSSRDSITVVSRADNGSLSHGSWPSWDKWFMNLDGSRGSWVSTCDPLTLDPLTDVTINKILRTISLTFGIRPSLYKTHDFLLR